uniref:C2H2-type domain-containing protein n=1 Tax=Stomoxys calcitrans TaxID=35570 RepID=A0A1I8P5H1_STOCA
MESAKCYLCDHEFVNGEEPWLMFEQRLREDGHVECSLAVLLGSILQLDLDEGTAHSTLLCDSCNADILEYESLEKRFAQLRERILNSYKENNTIHDLVDLRILHNENSPTSSLGVNELKFEELIHPSTPEMIGICDTDLIEEVQEDEVLDSDSDNRENTLAYEDMSNNEKVISESFDFAAFNEHVAQNSLPPGVLNLSDGLVNINVADSDIDVQNIPLKGQDIIIYDVRAKPIFQENALDQKNSKDDDLLKEYENEEDISLNFITSSNVFSDNDANNDGGMAIQDPEENESLILDNRPKRVCKQNGLACICLLCEISPIYTMKTLKEHFQSFHNSKIYMCELCQEGFGRREDLKIHSESNHTIECDICHRAFTNHRLYRIHRRIHYGTAKSLECIVCQKKYSTKGMLEEHMNTHTGRRPYKCPECQKDFASKYTLQTHMKIHKERPRPFQCNECGKQFLNQQNLSQHKKLHVSGKAFECSVCKKTFTTQHSLQVHQIVHSGQRPFICRICGKSFARRPEIKDHERIHTGEKPYKCDMCPLAFAQRSNLTSHKKSTHFNEKLHKCDHCLRSFKRKRLLEYHIQAIHTGERPHKCEICGAGFVYPEHFKKHMLIHSGKKPFACEVCGKQFNSRDNRNAHRFVHSDKKPYECMECGAGFMRKPLLLTHMKQTKHTNDTIIVNQPQFTQNITMEDQLDLVDTKTFDDEHGMDDELQSEDSEEGMAQIIFKTDELLAVDNTVSNVEGEADEDVITVESNLIKDELGVVKYLQFEDLERDGGQTLTWVDIGDDNKL